MSKYLGVTIAENIANYGLEVDETLNGSVELNKNNKGDLNMMNIEKYVNLDEYEIASEITIPEMNDILNVFELQLASIAADCKTRFFQTKFATLKKMQIIVETYRERANNLCNKFKYKYPAETNRFALKLLDIQFTYAGYVVGEDVLKEALIKCIKEELPEVLIKKSEYQNIVKDTDEVTIDINVTQPKQHTKSEIEMLSEEIKALKEKIRELEKKNEE